MDEYDDIGFDYFELPDFTDYEGAGFLADLYSPEQIQDFTDYEGAGFIADIAKEYPNFANMSNEELDAALGQAYQKAGLKLPDDKKSNFLDIAKKALTTPAGLAAAGTALYGLLGGGNQPQTAGYKGTIPTLTSVRERIKQPEYVPYSGQAVMGRQFFTPQQYVAPGEAAATRTAAQETAKQMESAIPKAPDAAVAPNTIKKETAVTGIAQAAAQPVTPTSILQDFLNRQTKQAEPSAQQLPQVPTPDERFSNPEFLAQFLRNRGAEERDIEQRLKIQAESPRAKPAMASGLSGIFDSLRKNVTPNVGPVTGSRTGLMGEQAPPGYIFGPDDRLIPDPSSNVMGPPAKEKPNFTAPFNPDQSLVQPIVNPARPGEMAELEYYADNYADLWSQQPRVDGSNVMSPPAPRKPNTGGVMASGAMPAPPQDFAIDPEAIRRWREEEMIYSRGNTPPGQEFNVKSQAPQMNGSFELPMIGAPAEGMSKRVAGAAQGGIMQAAKGRYLRGETDGMADKIPSSIDGVQPAALSHGEFVIPADVVSHLGNGNSDAGAEQLYKMMDRVRKDRTGTTKQGKKINPDKYLGGGIAGYYSGGVAKFQTGGSSSLSALSPTSTNPLGSTAETTLAPYIGDYATGMLGRAQALAQSPYEAYTGPLTAGTSPLQQQAFTAAGQIDPSKTFSTQDLQAYMNPYTQLALQPQLDELRRQAEISQANLQGQFSKAGAFGGGREAIARTENLRNLGQTQAGVIGKGFENAFNQAMQQYNVGRQQSLADLAALSGVGAQQRSIEQEGITALQKQFEQEQADPYNKLRFQQSMMQGLPVGTTSITPNLSELGKTGLTLKQATDIYDIISKIPGFTESLADKP